MTKIEIIYTKFNFKLPEDLFNQYLTKMPISLQKKNLMYHRWQDRHSNLFGKLLLLTGLKSYGYKDTVLNQIKYNKYSRPFIDDDIDFNISHSGRFVICAVAKDIRLGLDIEEIKEINFDDFRQVMTTEQWEDIEQSTDTTSTFFKYWSIKESVIKADSRGLSIPLLDIHVKNNIVCYDDQTWFLNELYFGKRHSAFLASNKQDIEFKLKYIDFYLKGEWNMELGECTHQVEDGSNFITNAP